MGKFTDGPAVTKYRNVTRDACSHLDPSGTFADKPNFSSCKMYLVYAETTLRNGGILSPALQYINTLRTQEPVNATGNITAAQLTADFYFRHKKEDRELYSEHSAHRSYRTMDLTPVHTYGRGKRRNKKQDDAVEDFRNLYPLPSSDVVKANPNLVQNAVINYHPLKSCFYEKYYKNFSYCFFTVALATSCGKDGSKNLFLHKVQRQLLPLPPLNLVQGKCNKRCNNFYMDTD